MNLIKFLIPKDKIVGIDIGSKAIRMLYMEQDAYGNISIKGKSDVELPETVIDSGAVANEKILVEAFNKLKNGFRPKKYLSNFAIVSIPPNKIFSCILEYPKILDNQQLLEAITTNAQENFPYNLSTCYFDWEIIGTKNEKYQVLVSMAPKKVIDEYIKALKSSGFDLIALETHFLSLERIIDLPSSPTILAFLADEGINYIVYVDKRPYFSQFETWQEISGRRPLKNLSDLQKSIKFKIDTIHLHFESKSGMRIEKALIAGFGFDADKVIKKIGKTRFPVEKAVIKIKLPEKGERLIAAAAAARAFIPRSDDTIISLLPVGTESLYETQKAVSFSKSILFFISSLAIFYSVVLSAFLLFVSSLETNLSHQLNLKNSIPISAEYSKMAAETKEFNAYLKDTAMISPLSNANSSLDIEKIGKLLVPGIFFNSVSIDYSSKTAIVSGMASSRESFRFFKNSLANSSDFSNLLVSSSDIAKKYDINFSLTMNLK